ncbi:MAG: SDR family NAD(P)-dependent oxidoreductase [Planctomycetota bacterium]|jgi:NAD(P)-dependent dehydrogenase (short-subunit alcohol dehydrogenase family)
MENSKSIAQAGSYLIIGATGGMGSAVTRGLSAQGAHLLLGARGAERLDALGRKLGGETRQLDASDPDQVYAFFEAAAALEQPIAGVVLCVGSVLLKPAHLTTDDEWQELIAQNLTPAFATVRAAGTFMKRGGSVVMFSSAAARIGLSNHDGIAAVKAGIQGLCQSAAATYARRQLRFNVIAPGLVRTPLTDALVANDKMLQASVAMHPLQRIGEPDDIASAVLWLLDPRNSWVTGQVFGVDGGLGVLRPR